MALKINTPAAKARTRAHESNKLGTHSQVQIHTQLLWNIFFAWKQDARRILTRPMVSSRLCVCEIKSRHALCAGGARSVTMEAEFAFAEASERRTQPVGPPRCAGCLHRHNWRNPIESGERASVISSSPNSQQERFTIAPRLIVGHIDQTNCFQ